jgi:hypothetical protein
MEAPVKKKTWKPTTAGILSITDGAFSIMGAFFLLIASVVISAGSSWVGINETDFGTMTEASVAAVILVMAIITAILAILEIVGGIFALRRKAWGLALAGSIAAALPLNILGILAIIFLAMSKDEFS